MSSPLSESEVWSPPVEAGSVAMPAAEAADEPLELGFVEELRREPSLRDQRIFREIFVADRDVEMVAAEFGLAIGTVENIARRVKRWRAAGHELLEDSTLDMLLLEYDQLRWQSRQLKQAWEYSGTDREVIDRIFLTTRVEGQPEKKVEKMQTRRIHSKGPSEQYMRLHDKTREKMLAIGREVKELQASGEAKRAQEAARVQPPAPPPSPTSEIPASASPPQAAARPAATGLEAELAQLEAEVAALPPSPLGSDNVSYEKHGNGPWVARPVKPKKVSNRQKHRERQEKFLRLAERWQAQELAAANAGQSQQGVIGKPQPATPPKVAPSQVE